MSNVVAMRQSHGPAGSAATDDDMLLHNLHSPLMFTAYERPLWYEGRTGNRFNNTKHKALIRMKDDAPVCLNVVRDTYKVVQNDELFDAIHEGLRSGVTSSELRTAKIKDSISYGGALCFREYVFPDISFASPERDKIAFRVIIQNGFGTGSIKLLAGAIDFFCTNGLVIGEYTSTYAKHTKGLQISRFKQAVEGSVHMFWKNKDMFADLAGRKVLNDKAVLAWLTDKFGDRLGARLHHQYLSEVQTRGRTLWAVYSALTYYSSHSNGEFSLRNTGNDHAAATMIKRENDVRRIMDDHESLFGLAEAA